MMKQHLSIRGVTSKYLTMVLLVALLGLMVLAWLAWHSVEEDVARHQRYEMSVLQRQFSELLGYYHGVAARLSQKREIAEILEFGDHERAVAWAKEVRELLPESIGVALIDPEGEILGEPMQLNLGSECVSDLKAFFSGEHVAEPPVHRANPRLAHFDVVHQVEREGQIIGVLFVSFSLDIIQQRVNRMADREQTLMVVDSEGVPLAATGDNQPHQHHWGQQHQVLIEGTDWTLLYRNDRGGANDFLIFTLAIAAILSVVTIAVMLVLSLRLVALFKGDLGYIREQLSGVYSGKDGGAVQGNTLLSETSDIMRDVAELMDNIRQANKQLKELSLNDELSGLLNRRGFYEQLRQEWELSARGVASQLILLDLDHFKQVNDRYGHGVGDKVIAAFAAALRERCRKTDITARLGGDEFAVVLSPFEQREGIEQWYRQLAELFAQLLDEIPEIDELPGCTISAGAVRLDKERHVSLEAQMVAVDRVLYRAKEQGRGRLLCG